MSRRYWAARALDDAVPGRAYLERLDVLARGRTILGDAWPELRAQLKDMIA
ncbi:hypothetical protein [Nonomuraea salmonea]|uniref:Uncharacterized protein n=1 Tax=Nonomuraea salmonea TaxID=46181 RepID=A0ABV5P0V9_9ACTN